MTKIGENKSVEVHLFVVDSRYYMLQRNFSSGWWESKVHSVNDFAKLRKRFLALTLVIKNKTEFAKEFAKISTIDIHVMNSKTDFPLEFN